MKSTRIINEIKSKCRVCLCENVDIIDIYSIDNNCGKISSAVMECSSIQIEPDDQLPTIICKNCLQKLREAYKFRQLCRLSDQTLRQYINFIVNQSTADILVKTKPTNFIITNTTDTSTVTQLICESTPVILKPNTNIVINSTPTESSQINRGISTILTQAVNYNGNLINMPIMVELSDTNAIECNSLPQQVNEIDMRLSASEHVIKEIPLMPIKENDTIQPKKLTCRYCNKNYETKRQLVRHETVTHGERKFICTICEHKFTEKSVLKSHIMAKHTDDRPFKCQLCDKNYVSASHLRIHMRLHTGEQPYKCEQCGKRFTSMNVYKNHVNTHSGLRPFQCAQCPLKFTRLEHLQCHITRIHDLMSSTTACDGGEFQKELSNNEECRICKKKFQRKELLKRHSRTHTNDKPFKCTECLKSFIRRWDLNRHLIMHKRQQLVIV